MSKKSKISNIDKKLLIIISIALIFVLGAFFLGFSFYAPNSDYKKIKNLSKNNLSGNINLDDGYIHYEFDSINNGFIYSGNLYGSTSLRFEMLFYEHFDTTLTCTLYYDGDYYYIYFDKNGNVSNCSTHTGYTSYKIVSLLCGLTSTVSDYVLSDLPSSYGITTKDLIKSYYNVMDYKAAFLSLGIILIVASFALLICFFIIKKKKKKFVKKIQNSSRFDAETITNDIVAYILDYIYQLQSMKFIVATKEKVVVNSDSYEICVSTSETKQKKTFVFANYNYAAIKDNKVQLEILCSIFNLLKNRLSQNGEEMSSSIGFDNIQISIKMRDEEKYYAIIKMKVKKNLEIVFQTI